MKRLALAMFCAAVSGTATAGLFGPSNFDECILANMKGVGSDMAARAVAASCAKQFPQANPAEKSAAPTTGRRDDRRGPSAPKPGEYTNFVPDPAK
jgi:hypothetical protein